MGDRFKPDVANAWSHLFVYLMEKLEEEYYSQEVSFDTHLKTKSNTIVK